MVRAFINLFLSLILPIGALFSAIGILYYLKDFELTKAVKLGVVSGVLSAIAFSFLVSSLILVKRAVQIYRYQRMHTKERTNNIYPQSRPEQEKVPVNVRHDPLVPKEGQRRYIFLMDYDVTFEVALYAIASKQIGIIQKADKRNGDIVIRQRGRNVLLKLSQLSPHSSQIIIDQMENLQAFITAIKEKEFSFLEYR